MADLNRRFTVAAFALPFLFLMTSGLARANTIIVNNTSGLGGFFTIPSGVCTLPDAITAANSQAIVAGCNAGSGDDEILIAITGTIFVDAASLPLFISDQVLEITTLGDGPVVIDGGLNHQLDGGIFFSVFSSKFLELENLTFQHGLASNGGAIAADGTDLDIRNCLFVDNVAQSGSGGSGGAIFGSDGTIEITNSTFFHNVALKYANTYGGAIFMEPGTPLKLTNDTFEANYAQNGSAIWNDDFSAANVDVKGTIFADHLDKAGTGVTSPLGNCAGNGSGAPVTDENYNISVDNSCGFTAGSSLNNVTAAALNLDPLGLQNNGGPSFTVALEGGSDALNRIPVADCTEQDSHDTPLGVDQRLFGRPDLLNLNFCDSGAFELGAVGPYTLNNQRVQIARGATASTDQINIGLTFTSNGDPDCDLDEDALKSGVNIFLIEGTCASLPDTGIRVQLFDFDVHTVNHQEYGTLFESAADFQLPQPTETVSARMVALKPPTGACGEWTLNLEVAGLDTGALGLGGGNPFALIISDGNDAESCFDLTNPTVQVGNQIPTPSHSVRRGVRR